MGQLRRNSVVLDMLRQVARSKSVEAARRQRAIWALGESGTIDTSDRELLRNIAQKESDAELRRCAVRALRNFPSRATVNTLRRTVHDEHRLVRLESISSFDACTRFNITPGLISALADSDLDVGTAAIEALVAIGQKRGVLDALTEAANADDVLVRRRAVTVLARLAASDKDRIALKATRALRHHINERDKLALLEVAWGLFGSDCQISVDLFKRLLEDKSEAVRELARERCEDLGILH